MNGGKICVSVYGETAGEMLERIELAADSADVIELRLDYLSRGEIATLLDKLPADHQYLITFRPKSQGGRSDAGKGERIKLFADVMAKLRDHDFMIDYEPDIDFPLGLDPQRAIVSFHDFESAGEDLPTKFDALASLTGKTIKIAVAADDITDAIAVWKLLDRAAESGRTVIPIAMGDAGKWTRILGPAYGSPITYGSLADGVETAPGQITGDDLRDVYRATELDRDTEIYGLIAGDPSYSLSPFMQNAAFTRAGLNNVFIPLKVSDLGGFFRRMVMPISREIDLNFRGFSVTNPHKQEIHNYLTSIDEVASKIGAVNTVKIDRGELHGFNTDAGGFIKPLKEIYGDLRDARVSIVGAGGASRACIYSLRKEDADVTVFAREIDKALVLADEFGVRAERFGDDVEIVADILVNATPLGTKGAGETQSIATADELRNVQLVYDLVYNPSRTRLLQEAVTAGAKTIGGLEMLVAQGARQFEIWTDRKAPIDEMRRVGIERLSRK